MGELGAEQQDLVDHQMEPEVEQQEIQKEAPGWNGIKKVKQEFIQHAGLAVSLVKTEFDFRFRLDNTRSGSLGGRRTDAATDTEEQFSLRLVFHLQTVSVSRLN